MEEERRQIEAVLAGDIQSFEHLVEKYQKPIFYLCLRFLGKEEEADEVTQNAFIRAYRSLGNFRFESSFKTWLTTIAINLCKNVLKSSSRLMVEVPDTLSDGSQEVREEQEFQQDRRATLKKALEKLPERQREVVCLRIYEEMPFKEVAFVLKSTESAVKVNFHHAMKSLKDSLG